MIRSEVDLMNTNKINGGENGAKPRWKRPKEKKKYTEAEMQRIKATRAVLEVIREMKEAGEFDEFLAEEHSRR